MCHSLALQLRWEHGVMKFGASKATGFGEVGEASNMETPSKLLAQSPGNS